MSAGNARPFFLLFFILFWVIICISVFFEFFAFYCESNIGSFSDEAVFMAVYVKTNRRKTRRRGRFSFFFLFLFLLSLHTRRERFKGKLGVQC